MTKKFKIACKGTIFFVILQAKMKKVCQILLFVLLFILAGCSQSHQLRLKEERAERELEELQAALINGNADSVWMISQQSEDIQYIISHAGKVIFWSDNTLTAPNIYVPKYNEWYDFQFTNAICRCMWRRVDDYQIEAIIPIKWELSEEAKREIGNSFSYRPLLQESNEADNKPHMSSRAQVRLYFILTLLAFLAIILWGIILIIRARGYRNLRLTYKIQFTTLFVMLIGYISVFVVAEIYIRNHYRNRQEQELKQKCLFIQTALQNLYFWDFSLSSVNTEGLNADLRDLAYVYGTDIHVYGLDGRLIGSSTPSLFQYRFLSFYLAPEVMFSNKHTMTSYTRMGDMRYLSAYSEFVNGSYIQLGYIAVPSFISEREVAQEVDAFLARLLPLFILALLAAVIFSLGLSHAIVAPIKAVADQMSNLSFKDPNAHVSYMDNDEIGQLVSKYNHMVDELALSSRKLAQSEREMAWRTMARQIAHEINNPLTPMKLTVQQLQRLKGTDKFDAQFDKASNMLIEQIDNLSRIATSFSTFAKQPQVQIGEVDIAQKLTASVALYANNPQQIPIRYFGQEQGLFVLADKEQIGQVFTNIIRNAVQAIGENSKGDIMVILKNDPTKSEVEIAISDNGPGIPLDIQPKIFLPNFTTKSMGAGLGLAISKNIVEGSNGRLTFETSKKGTTFFIYLQKV